MAPSRAGSHQDLTLWDQALPPWLCLADWLVHFLSALLIWFCIPLWGENNPGRTRLPYRTHDLIFSFWIIHKEIWAVCLFVRFPRIHFPPHSVFLQQTQAVWVLILLLTWSKMDARLQSCFPEACSSVSHACQSHLTYFWPLHCSGCAGAALSAPSAQLESWPKPLGAFLPFRVISVETTYFLSFHIAMLYYYLHLSSF